jgi:CheY-like chemotaxis protein
MQPVPSVLLVEDDEGIRDSVAECLLSEGYSVCAVANGAEALAALRTTERPSVILVDLIMPVMDGAELIDALRADPTLRRIPVVLMTAASATAGLPRADDCLEKPFQLEDLLATVERHARPAAAA